VPRRRLAALIAALALLTPATAFAQSAGDEQYQDPFGDEQSQSDDQSNDTQSAQATPTPTPAPATAPTATAAAAQSAPAEEQLPRTGEDAALLALAGTVLLAGGVVLRRRVT
jgi:LPXTG-motif cell wall-anchored protein